MVEKLLVGMGVDYMTNYRENIPDKKWKHGTITEVKGEIVVVKVRGGGNEILGKDSTFFEITSYPREKLSARVKGCKN